MTKLFLDLDGVIINTNKFIQETIKNSGVDISIKEVFVELCKSFPWNSFLDQCDEINNSFEIIESLKVKYDLTIITHCYSDSEAELKIDFIKRKFKDVKYITVPFDKAKNEMVDSTLDSILIDDYIVNIDDWCNSGGIGVHFSDKENNKNYPIIDDLKYLLDIDFLKGVENR